MKMVQIATGSDRQVWANYLGRIIFSMNEIDGLLGRIRTGVFKEQLSVNWLKKTFSDRLTSIDEKIKQVPGSPAMDELKKLIERTGPLNEARNHIAHGILGLVGAPNDAPRGASFVMDRYHKDSGEMRTITFDMLMERTKEAMQLSDDYSRFLAMCQLHAEFIAPYPPSKKPTTMKHGNSKRDV
ncbi:hypothetical protein [Chromobacterium violaceum]